MNLAPGTTQWTYLEFHNATATDRVVDLEFDFRALPAALEVTVQTTVLAPGVSIDNVIRTRPATDAERDQVRGEETSLLLRLICWLRWLAWWLVRRLTGRDLTSILCRPASGLQPMEDAVHAGQQGAVVRFRDVEIRPDQPMGAVLRFNYLGGLPDGSTYRIEVRQVARGEVIGGSDYVLTIASDPAASVAVDEQVFDVPGAGDGTKYVPLSAAHLVHRDNGDP